MITHIIRLIESAIHPIHPQPLLQPVFVKQAEFVFWRGLSTQSPAALNRSANLIAPLDFSKKPTAKLR